jgi:hypothetical protein
MDTLIDKTALQEDAQAQIARLRAQIETLASEAGPALRHFACRAEAAATEATGVTRAQVKDAIGDVTVAQIGAVAVAAGLGWLVGRLMR